VPACPPARPAARKHIPLALCAIFDSGNSYVQARPASVALSALLVDAACCAPMLGGMQDASILMDHALHLCAAAIHVALVVWDRQQSRH